MSDLDVLRTITAQLRPPEYDSWIPIQGDDDLADVLPPATAGR